MYACMCVRGYVCGSSSDGGKGMYVRKVIMEIDTEAEVCKNPPFLQAHPCKSTPPPFFFSFHAVNLISVNVMCFPTDTTEPVRTP
jgi:hypothetical protein